MKISKYIDHTVLKCTTDQETVKRFCTEAKEYDFASVCVNPHWVKYVSEELQGTDVKTCCVIGFPLGANKTEIKVMETRLAIEDGAQEVDMVINLGALKSRQYEYFENDIRAVIEEAKGKAKVKVIIETSELTQEEKIYVCKTAVEAGADFLKTSSGYTDQGATVEDVKLMKSIAGDRCEVKASKGINNRKICDDMIAAGATRMGTSKGIKIVNNVTD